MSKGNLKVSKKEEGEMIKEKIPITFNEQQLSLINEYKGVLGNTKAEIVRNIVINWLLEREKKS